jgi:hypothetical protein
MILINLLPPELRRRHSGVSPVFVSLVGGGGLCLLLAILFLWVQFVRIPNARAEVLAKTEELGVKTAAADKVRALEAQIAEFKDRRNKIVSLLAHKVYWAHTLDELANLLNGPWTTPGFDVRCQELSITEAAGGGGDRRGGGGGEETVAFGVNWKYKLIGKERSLAGDYINSFFNTIKASKLWSEHGFTGKPEDSYRGDQPRMNIPIQRVVIEGNLDWQRVKTIKDKTLAGR